MPETDSDTAAYRAWAREQNDLPLYWQPRWLDLVAPEQWRAHLSSSSSNKVTIAWPYIVRREGPLSLLSKPAHTPYGGPWFTGGVHTPVTLPGGLRYGAFTVHQAQAAWVFGKRCRGCASQVVDLLSPPPKLDYSLRKRLSKGQRELTIRPFSSAIDRSTLERLLAERPECGSTALVDFVLGAQNRGFGRVLACYRNEDNRLEGVAGVVYDDRTAYSTFLVRQGDSHPATSEALTSHYLEGSRAGGQIRHDMQGGYLPGVRAFNARFGAEPEWYGQVRLAQGPLWKALEWGRGLTNAKRL